MKKLLLILLLSIQQLFALISIVPIEIGNKPGVSGKIKVGLETKRGNTHKDGYTGSMLINYDNNSSYVIWLDISAEYAEVSGLVDTSKVYSHLRYIHALENKDIQTEFFLQAQQDKFKAIEKRRLAGAGLRFKLFGEESEGKAYFGIGALYEYLRHIDDTIDPDEDNTRLSTYAAYTIDFNEDSNLAYTIYYQPRLNKFSDHVISNKFEIQLHVYLKLFLQFSVYYDVDSSPPNSIEKHYDFGQSTTFVLDF